MVKLTAPLRIAKVQRRVWPPGTGRRFLAEALVALPAVGLLAFAFLAGPAWLDRHFLPEFFNPRSDQLLALTGVRVAALALGLLLLLVVRPWLGKVVASVPPLRLVANIAPTAFAIVLALGASEFLLRNLPWLWTQEAPSWREPLRGRDPMLGWAYVPARTGRGEVGGRAVEYAFDPTGHRVAGQAQPVDFGRPSILFTGESIMSGHGLAWDETIPARTAAALDLQAANLAVEGYATDQAFLRLRDEWPRFEKPVAVVALFMPLLVHRNLDVDRPHLGPGLIWRAPTEDARLVQVFKRLIPYRSAREIDAAVVMTREALTATVQMARARGAVPVILIPQLTPETPAEQKLRRKILDEANLPYLQVVVDPSWHIHDNRHPDVRATGAISQALADYLMAHGVSSSPSSPAK